MNINEKRAFQIINGLVKKMEKDFNIRSNMVYKHGFGSGEEMAGALARVDANNAEYYVASVDVSTDLLGINEPTFIEILNEIICHELTHLVMIDFLRTAQVAAGDNEVLQQELRYKYEQFTSRLQKAFLGLEEQIEKLKIIKIIPRQPAPEGDTK